jgi:hypothetical protein
MGSWQGRWNYSCHRKCKQSKWMSFWNYLRGSVLMLFWQENVAMKIFRSMPITCTLQPSASNWVLMAMIYDAVKNSFRHNSRCCGTTWNRSKRATLVHSRVRVFNGVIKRQKKKCKFVSVLKYVSITKWSDMREVRYISTIPDLSTRWRWVVIGD